MISNPLIGGEGLLLDCHEKRDAVGVGKFHFFSFDLVGTS